MKSRRIVFSLAGICILFFVSSLAIAGPPSAKFAATWTTEPGLASVAVVSSDQEGFAVDLDMDMGYTLATIKVPQDKELLVGLSAEIGLVTDTSIRGKEGGTAKAIAGGAGWVTIFAVPHEEGGYFAVAEPGTVILSARVQVLEATLGGVLTGYDGVTFTFTDEQISLLLATCAAHHFNFVLPNMEQGVYDIVAFFTTGALAAVNITENCGGAPSCVSASAFAAAVVGKTMLTVQQVRAAADGLQDTEIEPWP